jgi:hypothetical protein
MNYDVKIRREKIRTALATAIMFAAAAAVFVLVLYGLYKIHMIKLPEPLERLLGEDETHPPEIQIGGDEQRIYASLSGAPALSDDYVLEYDIDPAVLLEILQDSKPTEAFYMEAKITYGDGQRTLSRELKLKRDGEKYRAQLYEEAAPKPTLIVCDGKNIEYTDYAAGGSEQKRIYPAGGDFSLEYQLGLPSIEIMLETGGEGLKISHQRTESDNLYFVECEYPEQNMRKVVYISVKYNCIFSAEIYRGETLVYRLATTRFEANPAIGNSDFVIEQ